MHTKYSGLQYFIQISAVQTAMTDAHAHVCACLRHLDNFQIVKETNCIQLQPVSVKPLRAQGRDANKRRDLQH